ncbi:MAG: SpaA isopeptide-forming pilin-related protein [Firmicutes bacterium]|nr:SpaA isopeptide-forming pilin-related protein [Bacillota bacterium]
MNKDIIPATFPGPAPDPAPRASFSAGDQASLFSAAAAAPDGLLTIIMLTNNIILTVGGPLVIAPNKIIMLAGNYTLTQAVTMQPTVSVVGPGNLTIDGVTITHIPGQTGSGVYMAPNPNTGAVGALTMNNGLITGNTTTTYGGGVSITGGTFTMINGAITNNRADRVGGGVYIGFGTFDMRGGQISSNQATGVGTSINTGFGGGIHSTASDITMTGGVISNNSAARDGGGICHYSLFPISIGGNASITGNTAGRSGGGIWVPHDNLANFTVGPAVLFANNSASTVTNRNPADDAVYFRNILGSRWTAPLTQGYNNYDIGFEDQPAGFGVYVANIRANKSAIGAALPAQPFQFGLFDHNGRLVTVATNVGGTIVFPPVHFAWYYRYPYTIRELTPSGNGWITDGRIYQVYIGIYMGGMDFTDTSVEYPQGIPSFVNRYSAAPAVVILTARKSAVGAPLPSGRFSFGVFDGSGNLITNVVKDASGELTFSGITLNAPGVYNYTIRELTPSGDGWTTDSTSYPVTVTVTDNNMGQLVASITYPEGEPAFVNTYSAAPAEVDFAVTKTALGAPLPDGGFYFGLYDESGDLIATAANNASGFVSFPTVTIIAPGVYHYTIRELTPPINGWAIDGSIYPVTVTVTDNSAGQLIPSIDYQGGAIGLPNFVNIYSARAAELTLSATKLAVGAPLPAGRFDFGVFDQNGNLIAVAANDGAGNVNFPTVTFSAPGLYNYTIREISLSMGGWTVDNTVYPVIIRVTDNGLGELLTAISYPEGVPSFTNSFSPIPTSDILVVFKKLLGWNHPEIPFTFGRFDEGGNLIDTAQNVGGVVEFAPLTYTATGVYNYIVRELTPSGSGWATDSNLYPVTVTITQENGQLIKTITYPDGQPTFINRYAATPAEAVVTASKTALGATLVSGEFTFTLFDQEGSPVAKGTNDAAGNVIFPPINLSAPGLYNYTVSETDSPAGWTPDPGTFPVLVTVTDNQAGQLVATVSYPAGLPGFTNVFSPAPASAGVVVFKKLLNWDRPEVPFLFGLFDLNGDLISTVQSAGGVVEFPPLTYPEPGVFNYEVRELSLAGAGWLPDGGSYPVSVTVSAAGGELVANVSYPGGQPTFVNIYAPTAAQAAIAAHKTAVGAPLAAGDFVFGVFDSNGIPVAKEVNDADGEVSFPDLTLTSPGVYDYTVRETAAPPGWSLDATVYRAVVTVNDNGMGQLIASVSYPDGFPGFTDTFAPAPAELLLTATKTAVGAPLLADMFSFAVFDTVGNPLVSAVNDAAGNVAFPAIELPGPGVYDYTVRETGSPAGWTADTTVYPVVVTVTDDGVGQLIVAVSYPEGFPEFTNTFGPAPAELLLTAHTTAVNAPLEAGMFTFTVFDSNGNPVAYATNDAAGNVAFPVMVFTAIGVYDYTVRETGSPDGWLPDTRVFPVLVTVSDNGSGQLVATVTYPDGYPSFTNTFVGPEPPKPATATVEACKRLCGARLCGDDFTFGLFDQHGHEVARATNDRCGKIVFPAVTFAQPGLFNYTVRELNQSGGCWMMDPRIWPVTVAVTTVTDNGAGQLVATVTYPEGRPLLVNRFCPPAAGRCNVLIKAASICKMYQIVQQGTQFFL